MIRVISMCFYNDMYYELKWSMWCLVLVDLCPLLDACMNMNMWFLDLGCYKSLSLECMKDMWSWIMLRGSFMWNLEPSGKIMYVEVASLNNILQVKAWWT